MKALACRSNHRAYIAWLILLSCATNSCAVMPGLTRLAGVRLPTPRTSMASDATPMHAPAVVSYVNALAQKLSRLESTERLGAPSVVVVVAKTSRIQGMSQFASPTIFVTRGLLNVMVNEAELACLLGHEIGHKVLHRHNTYKQQFSWKGILLTEEELRAQWNQEREQEADEYGAALCHKAGYDPYAFVELFERLARFQKGGLLASLEELGASHKDFRNRAKALRGYLAQVGIPQPVGHHDAEGFRRHLASLKGVRTGDAVNELVTGGSSKALEQLAAIKQELQDYEQRRLTVPVPRFLEIMGTLSAMAQRYGVTLPDTTPAHRTEPLVRINSFMKEVMSQESPLWDNAELATQLQEILALIARVGVGFLPVVNDAVDLYELFSGREFGSGRLLTGQDRALAAAGLLAGNGKLWREAAHGLELGLQESKVAARLGHRTVAEAEEAIQTAVRKVPDSGEASGQAFHHTFDYTVESIRRQGLRPGSYATPTTRLSPLQAHIELALDPTQGARNAVLEIDLQGLRAAGYKIPQVKRVSGQFGMPGGGYEMQFPYTIPPEFIKVVQP